MAEAAWINLLLIFTRIASFFVTLPFTSYRGIPNLVKVFFALVISYLLFLNGAFSFIDTATPGTVRMVLLLGSEVLAGLTLGFIVLLFFTAFKIAGQMADVKIGLSMAAIFDPQSGGSVTLISQFYYLFAIIIYFAVNGHHYLFLALAQSFELIPLGGASLNGIGVRAVMEIFYYVWVISFQIAAPIVATVLITDISLGLISKTVPQLHVFLVGLPLKVLLGLFVVYLTLPYMSLVSEQVFGRIYTDIIRIMESMT